MTCKDCLYFKRCVVLGVELDMKHDKEADKNCRHFKNKADFMEIVRCKNCKHCEDYDEQDEYGWYHCAMHEMPTKLDNFCNFGERSDLE